MSHCLIESNANMRGFFRTSQLVDALQQVVTRAPSPERSGSPGQEDRGTEGLCDFEVTGHLRRMVQHEVAGNPAARVVIGMDTYPALAEVLARYVARRQREILSELEAS